MEDQYDSDCRLHEQKKDATSKNKLEEYNNTKNKNKEQTNLRNEEDK